MPKRHPPPFRPMNLQHIANSSLRILTEVGQKTDELNRSRVKTPSLTFKAIAFEDNLLQTRHHVEVRILGEFLTVQGSSS